MKKNAKRLLGLLIALAMMVSLVGTMALADSSATAEKPVVTYIGTSVSSGFFLPRVPEDWVYEDPKAPNGKDTSDWDAIVADGINDFGKTKEDEDFFLAYHPYEALAPNSAPRLVAEGLQMKLVKNRNPNFHKMCFTGLRTSELLRFLYGRDSDWDQKMKDDWISEEYMAGEYSGFTQDDFDWLYDEDNGPQRWIKDSKYVIVEIGANDVMTTVIENLFKPQGYYGTYKSKLRTEETYQAMIDLAMRTGDPGVVVTKALELAKKAGELPLMMTAMTKALLEGTMMFYTNYGKVIKQIYELNPKATVLAVGTFNPLEGVKISDNLPLQAKLLMDPNIRMMNAYIKSLAPYALSSKYDYRYVDDYGISLAGIDQYTLMGLLTSDKISEFDARKTGPIHPNVEGHRYLANQILKAIDK